MSVEIRITIAVVALLCALGFAGAAFAAPDAFPNPGAIYGCGAFCLLVALACLGGPVGEIVRRIVAGLIFVGYVWYLVTQLTAPAPALLSGSRSKPSIVNAAAGLLLMGVPCALYAAFGFRLIDWFRNLNRR